MSVLVMTCPHCGANNMTFNVSVDHAHGEEGRLRSAIAICARCDSPVVVKARWLAYAERPELRSDHHGDLLANGNLRVLGLWPKAEPINAPQHLPDAVHRAYMEAAKARKASLWNAACSSYRRCMELGLKAFAPEVEAWKLEKRIDRLAAEHRITPDLKTWAHELRLDGNEAVHGDEDATQEITDQMHHLTYFLLTYLYTLPKQVEEARVRRGE